MTPVSGISRMVVASSLNGVKRQSRQALMLVSVRPLSSVQLISLLSAFWRTTLAIWLSSCTTRA